MDKSFRVSPRILAHLGADLIKNESIALLELAKNSYDACASYCNITFMSIDNKISEIHILDDGFGMNRQVVEDVYLTLGTDFKYKNKKTNTCGRLPLGEKGIGRLGIHKLGEKIHLISKSDDFDEVNLEIDWTELDNAETISDFKIQVYESERPKIFKNGTGTKIVIKGLKNTWSTRTLREVYRDLNSLNSPFSNRNDSFQVNIEATTGIFDRLPDFDEIKDAALYVGHCIMQGNKIIDFRYEFKPWETLKKIDEGRVKSLHDLKKYELNLVDDEENPIDLNEMGIGTIEFDILIYELTGEIFSFVNTERKSIRDYLRENGGIRVYRDGMRVYNYGEQDNDWLGLDRKRIGRFAGNVANGMIIGSASINRISSDGLKEKSNREGFIENDSYYAFENAVEYAMSLIVRERNVDKHILTTLYKKHKVVEPVLSDLTELIDIVEEKIDDEDTKGEILKYLYRINSQYVEVKDVLIKSANAGLNLAMVIHEVEKLMAQLTGSIEKNEKEISISISSHLEKIIKGYSTMLKKSDIRWSSLSNIAETVLTNFKYRFLDHDIEIFTNWKSANLYAFYPEAEAISVLTNLVDNAIFWLKYARKKKRKLSIYITDKIEIDGEKYNSIIVSDNGPGFNIPADVAVKPFITGKPHNVGSGLGLHVATEMMKSIKGKLEFVEEDDFDLPEYIHDEKIDKAIIAICFPLLKK